MSRCRRFSILDGMILVAIAAMSLWIWKASDEYHGPLFYPWIPWEQEDSWTREMQVPYLDNMTDFITQAAAPFLMPASFGLWVIRLRRPRPILRRIGRQPGFAATSAVVLIVTLDVAGRLFASTGFAFSHLRFIIVDLHLVSWFSMLRSTVTAVLSWIQTCLWYVYPLLGAAVAASWAVMALGRCWRAERGWIDRSGIVLGCLWIIVLVADCLSYNWFG